MTNEVAIKILAENYPKKCKMVNSRLVGGFADCDCLLGQAFSEAIRALKKEEEQGWIPCSEALPDECQEVAVILCHTYCENDGYTEKSIARRVRTSDGNLYWNDKQKGYLEHEKYKEGFGGDSEYKVVAWMPLPDHYKVKEE